MKGKMSIAKTALPWTVALILLIISVIAINSKNFEFLGNFKFEAIDVMADIEFFEGFTNSIEAIDTKNLTLIKTVTLNAENQTTCTITLGEEGFINFTSALPIYVLKISIKNNFKKNGRNILIDYALTDPETFYEYLERLELMEWDEIEFDGSFILLPPGESIELTFAYCLDTEVSESFDTSTIQNFTFGEISLIRG